MLWQPKHPNIMPIDRSVGVHCRSNLAVTDNSVARELGRAVPVPRAGNGLQLQREHSRRVRTTPCAPERSPSASRREAHGILRVARRMRARHRARFPAARARLLRATACAGCVGAATALLPACRAWRARRCVPAAETSKCGALAGRTWRARRAVQARAADHDAPTRPDTLQHLKNSLHAVRNPRFRRFFRRGRIDADCRDQILVKTPDQQYLSI